MCFVFIREQTATCATYSINWLVFITEMKSVYSAVRTGSLNKAVCASFLNGWNTPKTLHLKTRTLYPRPNKHQAGESHTIVGALRCWGVPLHTLLFNFSSGSCPPSFLYFCTVLPSTAHYPILRLERVRRFLHQTKCSKQHNELPTLNANLTHNCAITARLRQRMRNS